MIKDNVRDVLTQIDQAKTARLIDCPNQDVTLIAVTKTRSVDEMREAIDSGINNIGENRVQEAAEKFPLLDRNATRHLIGHLQTNKAKQAVKLFDLIHSIDSPHVAQAVDHAARLVDKVQDILIQINLAREPQKSGVLPEGLDELIAVVESCQSLRLRGFMTIAPNYDDVELCRPLFKQMFQIFSWQRSHLPNIDFLSMGMSHDYKIAVEEGANLVRIGTALFGQRHYT